MQEALELFGETPRPEHFTNHTHCSECAEHDETLRNETLESLSYDHLRPGWDPLCFINPEGFQYYFPALVRLALEKGCAFCWRLMRGVSGQQKEELICKFKNYTI